MNLYKDRFDNKYPTEVDMPLNKETLPNRGETQKLNSPQLINYLVPMQKIRIDAEKIGGAYGVMVIVVGNGHGDTSSNPRRD